MQHLDAFFELIATHSALLFVVLFFLMIGSSLLGKHIVPRHKRGEAIADDETKIVLGALLSLLFLLMGFILSIAIGGYNDRSETEVQESIAIAAALQHSALLSESAQSQASSILNHYLDTRIAFFESSTRIYSDALQRESMGLQKQLWNLAVEENKSRNINGIGSVFNAYTALYDTQFRTASSWRDQIPSAAWILLIIFSIAANYLIGYNARGMTGRYLLIVMLPLLTTLALFMIAEIDVPGEGVIFVRPDDLILLKTTIAAQLH